MVKINMMCGKRNFGEDWVHIDGADFPHIHSSDIGLMAPNFKSNVSLIYCSHGISYFDRVELGYFLGWWMEALEPGGTLRLATPDFAVLSKFYGVGLDLDRLLGPLYGRMPMNETTIYHKTVYDEASLTKILEEAGFVNVRRYDNTKTEHPNTGNREDFFDDHAAAYINGTLISLNMECNKP